MKKIKWILLIILATIQIAGHSQASDKDEMIKKIFSAFKNKDEKAYIKLFPDVATIKDFFITLSKSDTTGEMDQMIKASIDEMTDSSLQASLARDFRKYIKVSEQKGVAWNHAVFTSHNAVSLTENQDGITASKLKGKLYFTSDNKEYFIKFDDIIWFESKGWYGVEIKRIDEKSKENMPDDMEDFYDDEDEPGSKTINSADMDSTLMIDSIAKRMMEKPVKKTKQPVKPKPAKPNTQTPAKKPE
jgi:hypothetical protein